MVSDLSLKREIDKSLRIQGYDVADGVISLNGSGKDVYRKVQEHSRFIKVKQHIEFLRRHERLALDHIVDGRSVNVQKIRPELIEVQPGTKWETLFRWWCLVWWSIPYERPIGRQMRFVVWDAYHKSIIGLIGLQSPILDWAPRDTYLNLKKEEKVLWVNQSLNAQRVGALPPYNKLLGGKLVASLLACKKIRAEFEAKYRDRQTLIENRVIPNRLLFITTTGAFGKSPIYQRLSYQQQKLSFFLGYTQGFGSFHIPDDIYRGMLDYLSSLGIDITRGYGSGPSRKMRLISMSMSHLGFSCRARHGIKRGLYLLTSLKNLKEVVSEDTPPRYVKLSVEDLSDFWKERWIVPRLKDRAEYMNFEAAKYIEKELNEIECYGK